MKICMQYTPKKKKHTWVLPVEQAPLEALEADTHPPDIVAEEYVVDCAWDMVVDDELVVPAKRGTWMGAAETRL